MRWRDLREGDVLVWLYTEGLLDDGVYLVLGSEEDEDGIDVTVRTVCLLDCGEVFLELRRASEPIGPRVEVWRARG